MESTIDVEVAQLEAWLQEQRRAAFRDLADRHVARLRIAAAERRNLVSGITNLRSLLFGDSAAIKTEDFAITVSDDELLRDLQEPPRGSGAVFKRPSTGGSGDEQSQTTSGAEGRKKARYASSPCSPGAVSASAPEEGALTSFHQRHSRPDEASGGVSERESKTSEGAEGAESLSGSATGPSSSSSSMQLVPSRGNSTTALGLGLGFGSNMGAAGAMEPAQEDLEAAQSVKEQLAGLKSMAHELRAQALSRREAFRRSEVTISKQLVRRSVPAPSPCLPYPAMSCPSRTGPPDLFK